jgi:hypothetical protein
MGDWTLRMKTFVAGLAVYNAIIKVPTLEAGGAIIDVRNRKVHFREWNVTFDCTVPEAPPKGPNFRQKRGPRRSMTRRAMNKGLNEINVAHGEAKNDDRKLTEPQLKLAPELAVASTTPISEHPIATATVPEKGVTSTVLKRRVPRDRPRIGHGALAAVAATMAEKLPKTVTSSTNIRTNGNVRMNGNAEYYRKILLEEFDDILVDALPNELPPLREINHRIPYKPTKPWIAHKYRLSDFHQKGLEKDIIPKLRSGILRYTSEIPLAASHMVPKQSGELRHVQDLQKRNEDT